jgi:SpoVK/Ycf46/Vps4 family AAA+-type ATPase
MVGHTNRSDKPTMSVTPFSTLAPALKRLDQLLARAVRAAQIAYGQGAVADPYRGLYIGQDEVERLLARDSTISILWREAAEPDESPTESLNSHARLSWLQRAFGLSNFDLDVVLIALALEIDLRYGRLYAYLQDDVTRKRPTVDLVLNLLCASAEEKLTGRSRFAPTAPLLAHRLLHLITEPNQIQPPLLAQAIKLDDQILRLIIEQDSLDERLVSYCELSRPAVRLKDLSIADHIKQIIGRLGKEAKQTRRSLRLYVSGPREVGHQLVAEGLAAEVGSSVLSLDLLTLSHNAADVAQILPLTCREAWFQNAILFIEGLEALRREEHEAQYSRIIDALAGHTGTIILAGTGPWVPPGRGFEGVVTIVLSFPESVQRRTCWDRSLSNAGLPVTSETLDALAETFQLTSSQIADAVATAQSTAAAYAPGNKPKMQSRVVAELFAAARAQSGHDLAKLAKKITPVPTWDDIVLPVDTLAQLRELCQRVIQRRRVLSEWGFDKKLSLGKGVNALFAGSSGTGKTMAAEVIANELRLDLYKIDLSGVVSKYIGETEKNLDRIFTAAEQANAILFFDEADALFGKRSEVRDSHDRYANIEISYLLQKMEQYEGITILASNLRQNLDDAFVRRLAFTIHFPFPDEVQRQEIWEKVWPTQVPLAKEVDLEFLAQQFKLSGGNIKNIALASAFLAAADGGKVTMDHLRHATQREYQKLGKSLSTVELGGVSNGTRVPV